MADRTGVTRTVWLLEHYEPGAPAPLLRQRIQAMAATASSKARPAVRLIAGAVLPKDEEALCLLEATSAHAIRAVCRESRFRVDRLTRVEPVLHPHTEDI